MRVVAVMLADVAVEFVLCLLQFFPGQISFVEECKVLRFRGDSNSPEEALSRGV